MSKGKGTGGGHGGGIVSGGAGLARGGVELVGAGAAEALAAIHSAGFHALAQHPIATVRVVQTSTISGEGGSYFTQRVGGQNQAGIRIQHDPAWTPPQRPASFADKAPNATERLRRVALHEAGHHAHTVASQETRAAISRLHTQAKPISRYGKASEREWVAESVSAFVRAPAQLQRRDPAGFAAARILVGR